jgi:2-C-methyl-D-erythritol 4-phosphate cytidylyltransferase
MKEKVVAIVPAAGIGRRFGDKRNKPFENLNSKPLIIWALEILDSMAEISEIIPVLRETDLELGVDLFEQYNISKIKRIAPGGRERQDSIFHGLSLIKNKRCKVMIHDGVRPLIEADIVKDVIGELNDYDGVVSGVPVKDTIKEVKAGTVEKTLARNKLWSIQTPQLFTYKSIYNAYTKAMREGYYATDDSALVERNGGRVKIVMGSYTNVKVTTPDDLVIAGILLKMRSNQT